LPPAPWILLDRTTVEQAAVVFERLEQWLAGADPQATTDCAHTCSLGQADPVEVAAWVGTLAAHLHQRIDISDAGGTRGRDRPAGAGAARRADRAAASDAAALPA
jgi:hypothetical protein